MGFVPGEPASINILRQVSIPQITRTAQIQSIPRGAFGDYPGVGPIPAIDTSVATPREPNAYVAVMVRQPLSQLKQIGTSVKAAAVGRDIRQERLRAEQLSVINAVKRIYFAILQTRSALAASEDVLALYRELERTLKVRVAERVALRPEALDIEARLADEQVVQSPGSPFPTARISTST